MAIQVEQLGTLDYLGRREQTVANSKLGAADQVDELEIRSVLYELYQSVSYTDGRFTSAHGTNHAIDSVSKNHIRREEYTHAMSISDMA